MDSNLLKGISLPVLFVVRSMPVDGQAMGPPAASNVDEVTLPPQLLHHHHHLRKMIQSIKLLYKLFDTVLYICDTV